MESDFYRRRLRFEPLEDRRMLSAGVTIITHGYQLNGLFPQWTTTMGQAVLDRADGPLTDQGTGSIFKHDPATGLWTPLSGDVWTNSNSPADHTVLLYDWADESNDLDDGWLEAAADNLFASLLRINDNLEGDLAGKSFLDIGYEPDRSSLDFHFIGHSRGAVLNSLVTERFDDQFDVAIQQVTSLDPHPASFMNDPGYDSNSPNSNSRLFTYDNVVFADNYFRQDGSYEPLNFDFNGVFADGAYNLQIPEAVLLGTGSSLEHSDVHTWYYGTITEALAVGYSGINGSGRNHDGDIAFPESWYGVSGVPARDAIGFHFSQIGGGSRTGLPISGAASDAGLVPVPFNGDFTLGNTWFFDELPGWERHAGGGTAELGGSQRYLELNSGGADFFRRHNPLYFNLNTTGIEYDYWINNNDVFFPNDELRVLIGETVIDTISLATETSGFVENRVALLNFSHIGFVDTLEFRIHDDGGDGIDSAVRIDAVTLVIEVPPPSADFDTDGDVDGADFLAWQRNRAALVGATKADGDADVDGDVDGNDLSLWQADFGDNGDLLRAAEYASIPIRGTPDTDPPLAEVFTSSQSPGIAPPEIVDAAIVLMTRKAPPRRSTLISPDHGHEQLWELPRKPSPYPQTSARGDSQANKPMGADDNIGLNNPILHHRPGQPIFSFSWQEDCIVSSFRRWIHKNSENHQ